MSKDDISKTKTKIEHIIVNAYVDNNKKFPFAHLVRLYWTLNNRLVVYNIFQDLKDLLELAVSFKSKFIYFYALKEVEDYFQSLYQNPEVINLESASDVFTTSLFGGKIAKDPGMLDITYALYQKYTIRHLRTMIDSYAEKNAKFIEDLSLGSTTFKAIHGRVKELYKFNKRISKCFDNYHSNSKNTENVHILPYCVHLCYNVNCLRSGKVYLSEFIKRCQIIRRIHDERNPMIMPDNLLIDSAIFLVESQPGVIGNIVDVYGETEKLLSVAPKNLIGKSPNYLIPATMAQYHDKIMQCYMSKPLRYFMGIQRDSFIRIPESKFIINSHIVFKLAPNIESGFKIVVASRPNQKKYNQKMIINQNFLIDSYSYNFLTLISDQCLAVNVPVGDLSTELFTFIQKQIGELEGEKGDVLRSKQKRAIVDHFNKHISKELAHANQFRTRREQPVNDQEAGLDESFDNLQKKHADNDERLFSSNIFELKFENSVTKKVQKKHFEITLEVKEFPDVDKRLYYLDMTPVDESDYKLLNFKKNMTSKSSKPSLMNPFQTEASIISPKINMNMDTQSLIKDNLFRDFRSKVSEKRSIESKLHDKRDQTLQLQVLELPNETSTPRMDSLVSIEDEADFPEDMIDEFGVQHNLTLPISKSGGESDMVNNSHSYKFLRKSSKPVVSSIPAVKTMRSKNTSSGQDSPRIIVMNNLGMHP